jgi:hypothetical protein
MPQSGFLPSQHVAGLQKHPASSVLTKQMFGEQAAPVTVGVPEVMGSRWRPHAAKAKMKHRLTMKLLDFVDCRLPNIVASGLTTTRRRCA